jgi:hypothetical protein
VCRWIPSSIADTGLKTNGLVATPNSRGRDLAGFLRRCRADQLADFGMTSQNEQARIDAKHARDLRRITGVRMHREISQN